MNERLGGLANRLKLCVAHNFSRLSAMLYGVSAVSAVVRCHQHGSQSASYVKWLLRPTMFTCMADSADVRDIVNFRCFLGMYVKCIV
jgi:hypothetical protein